MFGTSEELDRGSLQRQVCAHVLVVLCEMCAPLVTDPALLFLSLPSAEVSAGVNGAAVRAIPS